MGAEKVVLLNAIRMNQDGFKGIDNIRTGIKLIDKLEVDLVQEEELSKEILNKTYSIDFEDNEIKLLKVCMNSIQWQGRALKQIAGLYDKFEK